MDKNTILEDLRFDPEKGGLFYKEVRYLLIRPEVLAAFQKEVERELIGRAEPILFKSGYQGGSLSSKKYREVFNLSDHEIVRFMIEMGTQIGWGRFELERFDPLNHTLSVHVHHSPFALAHGTSNAPVCHFIRGVLSGMASLIFKEEREMKEVHCLAKGDPFCRFESV